MRPTSVSTLETWLTRNGMNQSDKDNVNELEFKEKGECVHSIYTTCTTLSLLGKSILTRFDLTQRCGEIQISGVFTSEILQKQKNFK